MHWKQLQAGKIADGKLQVTTGQHQHLTFRAITMARGELISALYDKATDMSITAVDPTASLTLMSADIERIDVGWRTMHEIWGNLVEIGVAVYLLERQLGIACLIPFATALGELEFLFYFPQSRSAKKLSANANPQIVSIIASVVAVSFVMARQALWLEAIERRIAVTSAMLGSMKGVKMCGLTDLLKERIQAMRVEELHISGKFRRLLIWNMGLGRYLLHLHNRMERFGTERTRSNVFLHSLPRPDPCSDLHIYCLQCHGAKSRRGQHSGHEPYLHFVVPVRAVTGADFVVRHVSIYIRRFGRVLRAHTVLLAIRCARG
jgi:hypothetical protein